MIFRVLKKSWSRSRDFLKKNVQRDTSVGVEGDAKIGATGAFRVTDSGSTYTIQP